MNFKALLVPIWLALLTDNAWFTMGDYSSSSSDDTPEWMSCSVKMKPVPNGVSLRVKFGAHPVSLDFSNTGMNLELAKIVSVEPSSIQTHMQGQTMRLTKLEYAGGAVTDAELRLHSRQDFRDAKTNPSCTFR